MPLMITVSEFVRTSVSTKQNVLERYAIAEQNTKESLYIELFLCSIFHKVSRGSPSHVTSPSTRPSHILSHRSPALPTLDSPVHQPPSKYKKDHQSPCSSRILSLSSASPAPQQPAVVPAAAAASTSTLASCGSRTAPRRTRCPRPSPAVASLRAWSSRCHLEQQRSRTIAVCPSGSHLLRS